MAFQPLISVITPVFNAEETLSACLMSVKNQSYPHLEHIVIDGGSHDESVNLINENLERISYWHSCPDKGISDAFNLGIQQSKGDYLYFLGASDTFFNDSALENLLKDIQKPIPLICGRVQRTDEFSNQPLWTAPRRIPVPFGKWGLLKCLIFPHQGLLMHRSYFEQYGLFDLTIRYAMDYELLLRSFHHFPEVQWQDTIVANWRAGGIGKDHLKKVLEEYHFIKSKHKIAPQWILNGIRALIQLKYSLNKDVA